MKRFKAVVIGGTGYGGAELIRRLLIHPDVELVRVVAVDHVGEPLGAVHPPLTGRSPLRFENVPPEEAARGADVALLALPHKVSAHHAPAIVAAGVKVVDMSGDFRLRDAAAYQRYYGAQHPHPELLGSFVYGLPELNRDAIRAARAVASPGCFATTIALGLLPLARAGKLAGANVHVVGMTGSSGSGIAPTAGTHHPVRAVNLKPYKVLEHQHTPEILETLTSKTATLQNFQRVRGMLRLLARTVSSVWLKKPADATAIHLHHIDLGYEPIRQEIITRLQQGAFAPAMSNDVAGTAASGRWLRTSTTSTTRALPRTPNTWRGPCSCIRWPTTIR